MALIVIYLSLVLSIIVATANHYWIDVVVAIFTVSLCFLGNRILLLLLPLEYCICWVLRIVKPVLATRDWYHAKHVQRKTYSLAEVEENMV